MKQGYLSQYFKGIAAKKLSAVEVDTATSNQHEYNGVSQLREMFGTDNTTFPTQFIYLDDSDDAPVKDTGFVTWYDARKAHPTRTEYRMYFPTTAVSVCAAVGDELFVGLRPDDTILVIVAEAGSTICSQLLWLFGIEETHNFSVRGGMDSERDKLVFSSRLILEYLDIHMEEREDYFLDEMVALFKGGFPTTTEFSAYARKTLADIRPEDDPDIVLMSWMEREELLFRTLEKHIVADRLQSGFDGDVDAFFKFSLSVQNRRKSRAGLALENHVEQLLICRGIKFDRAKVTENSAKPDFVFPSIKDYHDLAFNAELLTMLGAKSTCKDRWRQVLSEADRIKNKHLLTLEAAISANQVGEMEYNHLQLVVPKAIQNTYSAEQQKRLINVAEFLK